ncbi:MULTISPECIES: Cof-type HAD-IIB family hydrolase [unclassified Gemella]|uniref:Cof-type HAD-IIB family hydrolase n=1 Tax=unclassified Gemella TaxID=2624949 RepID=UPI00107308D2|nr:MULTISPECIES: Cof-type HAD-IIB family hydrolase [unclassified Gemella]MBF0710809.1 HAD family phosphatase [Gemella sp. GL1.1]MBF0746621.1 HAD family phosphatase [Gemella sp. 19428wG2_WT2a]NYS28153.1 HAD family phosphatase [Gemella sp. GL1]TFU59974.1 HAD family phosphatase [Gemella sp. WT2a]
MIKVVVTDIDDTLLDSKGQLSSKTKEVIEKCIEKDIKVILASGRPDFGMMHLVKELSLDKYDNYLLSYNGAKLSNLATGEVIYDKMLDTDRLKFLIKKSQEYGLDILTYQGDVVLTNKLNPYAEWEANALRVDLKVEENLLDKIKEKAAKVIMLDNPETAKENKEKVNLDIGDEYEVAMSKPFFIEVNDKGISKGAALEFLCKKLGIDRSEMIALGDGLNDLSMIEFAGLGVAMANANQQLKSKADYISKTNDEDGFAYAVEKFVLNEL